MIKRIKLKEKKSISKEDIENRLKEIFFYRHKDFYPKHYEWEEDGIKYSAWEISKGIFTGDGGAEIYSKLLAERSKLFTMK